MIALLAVVVLVGVGFWYVSTQRDVVSPEPTATPTPEIQELTSTVDTADWIESSYGESRLFSFKYPPDWTETITSGGYYYKPNNDPGYKLYVSDPTLNGETIDGLIDQILAGNYTVLSREKIDYEGHDLVILQTRSADENELITHVFVDETPVTLSSQSSEVLYGVLIFTGSHTNSTVTIDPHIGIVTGIAGTITFDR